MADMLPERLVEGGEPAFTVGIGKRIHLVEQIRMRADGALPEHDEIAGEDIGTLDGDADRDSAVEIAEIVLRTVDHGLAAMDVHGVVDRGAHPLGRVQLHDAGDDGGMDASVQRGASEPPCRVELIGGADDAGERLLDALELGDGDAELLADAGIGAGGAGGIGGAGRGQRWQRDAAAGGERRHQHLPALPQPLLAADDIVERDEDVVAPVRAVLEHLHRRQMAMADFDAGQIGRDQRHADAELFLIADEMIGVMGFEGEAQERRDRPERDVTLVPVEPEADDLAALEIALADDAGVDHRGRIGSGFRAGETEAGNVVAVGKTRQPALLLLLGAEVHQELAGAQRVRDHHRHRGGDRPGRDLAHHFRMRIGRKAEAAKLFRNDHAEEFFALDEGPHVLRQVAQFPKYLPLVEHGAELVDGAVEKGPLLFG
ncbi:hypothetical protein ACVWW3_000358 [Bradyrhizobium sp. LM2.9]